MSTLTGGTKSRFDQEAVVGERVELSKLLIKIKREMSDLLGGGSDLDTLTLFDKTKGAMRINLVWCPPLESATLVAPAPFL